MKSSGELYYPPLKWYESEINVLTVDEIVDSYKELSKSYQEAQKDDFLFGKKSDGLPNSAEEED